MGHVNVPSPPLLRGGTTVALICTAGRDDIRHHCDNASDDDGDDKVNHNLDLSPSHIVK